jgi:hypothetical protein
MNRPSNPSTVVEQMGLRLEDTRCLGLFDIVLVVALVLPAMAWVWVSLAGVEAGLLATLASPAGRLLAAGVGLAGVLAVVRVFLVHRWPATDSDRGLL